MNHGLSDTTVRDDDHHVKTTPTIGIIALRFVVLLTAIVATFAWAWSR